MEQGFIHAIQKMVKDYGKETLLETRKAKAMLGDFTQNSYPKETNLLKMLLDANCANIINEARDVAEVKTALVKRLEDDHNIAPKGSAEMLDVLGLVLRGDKSKTAAPGPAEQKTPAQTPKKKTQQTKPASRPKQTELERLKAELAKAKEEAETAQLKAELEKTRAETARIQAEQEREAEKLKAGTAPKPTADTAPKPVQAQTYTASDEMPETQIEAQKKARKKAEAEAEAKTGKKWYIVKQHLDRHEYFRGIPGLKALANAGHASAQQYLGYRYYIGHGVREDKAKAVEWWRKAADQGEPEAQYHLGCCYDWGSYGIPKDFAKAVELFRKAAAQGNSEAQYKLGLAYEGGTTVPKDFAKAVELFRKAAAQGEYHAQERLDELKKEGKI